MIRNHIWESDSIIYNGPKFKPTLTTGRVTCMISITLPTYLPMLSPAIMMSKTGLLRLTSVELSSVDISSLALGGVNFPLLPLSLSSSHHLQNLIILLDLLKPLFLPSDCPLFKDKHPLPTSLVWFSGRTSELVIGKS